MNGELNDIKIMQKEHKIKDKKEKFNRFTKHNIRFVFFSISSLITYILCMWNLFWKEEFLISWVLFCVLFIELIFLSIDVRGIAKKVMWWVLFIIWVVFSLLVPHPVWQVITAVWLSLITIGYLLVFLRWYFKNVRKIDWLNYFTRWGYIFTLLTSITFWFAILWINTKFPFQCDQISSINETLLKNTTSWLFFWDKDKEEGTIFEIEKNMEEIKWESDEDTTLIAEARSVFKENMVDWFIETKNSINNKVCEAIVSQIDQIYQNPVFQVGAVFWIYLLFYWVIRVIVRAITIIWYIIFTIVRVLWLYNIEKKEAIVEEVL